MPASSDIAIVGVGYSACGSVPGASELSLHHDAAAAALDDAGLSHKDVDGLLSVGIREPMHIVMLGEYLNLRVPFADSSQLGGGTWEIFIEHAAAAIRAGLCHTVLLTYGSSLLSSTGRSLGTATLMEQPADAWQFEVPYGFTQIAKYAMAAQRHMYEYGTTPEDLAQIAVTMRKHAAHNEHAMYREPITVDDVLSSPMIADPLHKLDCCVISDGGCAAVLTTMERARHLRKEPIRVLGTGSAYSHATMMGWENMAEIPAAVESSRRAYAAAGLGPGDVDTLQAYDSFTITLLLTLEALGFCKPGEGGPFVQSGAIELGGLLPTNTDGGGLSSAHPGMRGLFLIVEAVRQLRGECGLRQVQDAAVAMCHGTGGYMSACGSVLLGKD